MGAPARTMLRSSFALAALLPLLAATPAHAGRLYCCADDQGKKVCADILPQICRGRAYREISETGVVRQVEAPMTSEQRAEKAAEEVKRKEQEAALKEQQRKDLALLATYNSEKDIDVLYARIVQEATQVIKDAESRMVALRQNRKKFENEAEFYKNKRLPPDVQTGLSNSDLEIKSQESVVESKKKELEAARIKFESDRRRYLELKRPR